MVLLENYFNLTKEQRYKFLSKEERKELRQAKRERKQKNTDQDEEEEQQQEIVEQVQEVKEKKSKKSKKEKKKQEEIEQEEEQIEVEEETQDSEEQEQEKKKKKKSKKNKQQEQEEEEQNDDEEESKKRKKEKKKAKKAKKQQQESEDNEEEEEPKVEKKQKKEEEQVVVGDEVDAEKWRKENDMTIKGDGSDSKVFYPFTTFNNTGMPAKVMEFTKQFQKPSLIQSQAWPIVLQGRDCIAIAETGSGKTLGFLLPAFNHILQTTNDIQSARNPRVIIVSPTRELATQIHEVCEQAQKSCGIRSVCLYGGVSKADQKQMLKKGVQIVIGTPGRMKDLMQEGSINTKEVSMMVLDEADRMLDMGFAPDIKYLFSQVSSDRQSVMFSATWPKEVQEIANNFIKNPITIKIGTEEGTANKRVKQTVEVIKPFQRNTRLGELLKKYNKNNDKIIVFVLYKAEAPRVEQLIQQLGMQVSALHGDMSQKARNASFAMFKEGKVNILVATDVAARGLDIPNVEHVINYSFPLTVSDYVHRIGRTGRAGKNGNSYTFFQELQDKKLAGDLVQIMKESGQEINPELEAFGPSIHKRTQHAMYGDFYKDVDMSKKATKTLL